MCGITLKCHWPELDEEMKTLFSVQKIVIRQAFQNPTAASFNLQPQYWLGALPPLRWWLLL